MGPDQVVVVEPWLGFFSGTVQRAGASPDRVGPVGNRKELLNAMWYPGVTRRFTPLPMPAPVRISLTVAEEVALQRNLSSGRTPVRLRERSEIVLLAAAGLPNYQIAKRLGIDVNKVGRWRNRFAQERHAGIEKDLPRGANHGGRDATEQARLRSLIIRETTTEKPERATHWSTRSMAAAVGTNHQFVATVWKDAGLRPHLRESFKASNVPLFEEKLLDALGLYLDPPDRAVVFCVDERSSMQPKDRTQPGLPMTPGRCQTMTHDDKQHGTSTLFAALDVTTGEVIGECKPEHRRQAFLAFLTTVERETPAEFDLHLIVDNYATHKHEKVKSWLERNKRVHLHFLPTSSSWLNLVERFFGLLTDRQPKRGVFTSVKALQEAIYEFIDSHNANGQPFVWTKSANETLQEVGRAREQLAYL